MRSILGGILIPTGHRTENLAGTSVGRLPQAPEQVLHVEGRQFEDASGSRFRIDYVRAYAECAADPVVSRHLSSCLTIYPDEARIEVVDAADSSPLVALAYLNALRIFIERHLRRGFITREETLRGRVRGQVRMGCYITQGLARAHPETVPCRFQALEHDTLENRILHTALVGARRLLDRTGGTLTTGTPGQGRPMWHSPEPPSRASSRAISIRPGRRAPIDSVAVALQRDIEILQPSHRCIRAEWTRSINRRIASGRIAVQTVIACARCQRCIESIQ